MYPSNPIDTNSKRLRERLIVANTLHSAAELLPQLLNDDGVLNGEGSIAFTKSDKTTARIFLRKGNVYAVDNLDYEIRLWSELRFEKHITHSNLRALIRAHKSQRESLYKLLRKTRNKMKSDDNLVITLQEYALGAIDNIYSWDAVKVEWRMGDTFDYDAADVPEFPLAHLLTLCINRSLFKHKKYEEWGFKNDDQFMFGNVFVEEDVDNLKADSALEEAILLSKKFIIKGLIENTGYSIFTIASALDDLKQRTTVSIENPSGRQKPTSLPPIPHDVPLVRDKIYFSATDEDPDMLKVFNTEYHVPEPALLDDDGETFNQKPKTVKPPTAEFDSFDDVINDTSSIEIVDANLPPLKKEETATNPRPVISKEDLEKEENANDIAALYKSMTKEVPKARGVVKKPVAQAATAKPEQPAQPAQPTETKTSGKEEALEPASTPINEPEGNEMSSLQLIDLLKQVEMQLSDKKSTIDTHNRNIRDMERKLAALETEISRVALEIDEENEAKDVATAEYEKAVQIINTLNN